MVLANAFAVVPERQIEAVRRMAFERLRGPGRLWQWPEPAALADLRAMECGDIPYWSANVDEGDLFATGGEVVRGGITRTGRDRMAARLARMGREDGASEEWLIRTFLGLPRDRAAAGNAHTVELPDPVLPKP